MVICKKCRKEVSKELQVKTIHKPKKPEDDPVTYIRKICRPCFNIEMKMYKRKYDQQKKTKKDKASVLSNQCLQIALV